MRYVLKSITKFTLVSMIFIGAIGGINSCIKPQREFENPMIQFSESQGFVYQDTTMLLGDTILIEIVANADGDDFLTHFNTTIEKDTSMISIDTGIYHHQFSYQKQIVKGIARNETWSFYVRDRNGRKSELISLNLQLDSASIFGAIKTISSIKLGAQNNSEYGSFYSLATQTVYDQAEAWENQSLIHLLYFYDLIETDANTISSPGASIDPSVFQGSTGLSDWSLKNVTRFVYQSNLTVEDFDQSKNDSLILSNTFEFSIGKRKAKNLAPSQIYSFVTESGIKGLFKVLQVEEKESGAIEIAIKMQDND